jgi:hypothetical protein
MSSSHRDTSERQCVGKRAYRCKADAKSAARWAESTFRGSALHAYRCGRCDMFHVGHKATFQPQEKSIVLQEEVGAVKPTTSDHDGQVESPTPVVESAAGQHPDWTPTSPDRS